MTYGQPTDPRTQAPHEYPQQLWPDYAQASQHPMSGPPPAADWGTRQPVGRPARSAVLGVLALLVGLAALAAPFLPMDRTGFRQYVALPLAVPGIALAAAGLIGKRRGKPAAAIGLLLSALAFAIGAYMLLTFR